MSLATTSSRRSAARCRRRPPRRHVAIRAQRDGVDATLGHFELGQRFHALLEMLVKARGLLGRASLHRLVENRLNWIRDLAAGSI